MTRWFALVCLAVALVTPGYARAQLSGLPLPDVPAVGGVLEQLPEAELPLDTRTLRDARRLRVRELLRTHRRELEADPHGEPVVRGRIIALGMTAEALEQAQASGFTVSRRDALADAGEMITLRAPPRLSTRRALRILREQHPEGVYDFDHLHLESGAAAGADPPTPARAAGIRVGVIDGGVGAQFRGFVAAERAFASAAPAPSEHGQAVATILLSAAPGARLYAADVYGGTPTGGSSSALARALAWLASEDVPIINVSLVGPRNRIVEAVVSRVVASGRLIVAAVGNDGPAAPPLYPSAYPGVVGVTGVDARGRALAEAGRGSHVDFAAPGVLEIAGRRARGTSYAAPVVAGRLATHLALHSDAAEQALAALRSEARDLGARGRDDVYGYGLVGEGARVATR